MKWLVLSDLHFGNHKEFSSINEDGFNTRFIHQIKSIESILLDAERKKCNGIIMVGDLFHRRGLVETEVINRTRKLFNKVWIKQALFLAGNHDITISNNEFFSSTSFMFLKNEIIFHNIIQPISFSENKDLSFHFIPYQPTRELFEDSMETVLASLTKENILFIHQKIDGAEHNRSILSSVIKPNMIPKNKFVHVICGDIHKPQKIQHINCIGAPYHMDFGDEGSRYYYILEGKKLDKYENKYHPKFVTVDNINKIHEYDNFNFYRLRTEEKVDNKLLFPTLKVVNKIKLKNNIRQKKSDHNSLIKTYCSNEKRPEMVEIGIKLYNEFLGAR